ATPRARSRPSVRGVVRGPAAPALIAGAGTTTGAARASAARASGPRGAASAPATDALAFDAAYDARAACAPRGAASKARPVLPRSPAAKVRASIGAAGLAMGIAGARAIAGAGAAAARRSGADSVAFTE